MGQLEKRKARYWRTYAAQLIGCMKGKSAMGVTPQLSGRKRNSYCERAWISGYSFDLQELEKYIGEQDKRYKDREN